MLRKRCLICGSESLSEIIDLGMHPFADTFIPESKISESDKVYPLICDLCMSCGQIQTRCITNPADRYCEVEYSYTSSNSKFSRNHWDDYANEMKKRISLNKEDFIIEIGSNDGYLASQFMKETDKVLGIDPSEYMANLAEKRGVKTVADFFNYSTASKILAEHGPAKLIMANNVFNHSNDPLDFAKAVSILLKDDGVFVFELPYWYSSVKSKKFDQIYHEHVSYFTACSSAKLMDLAGMHISEIEVVDYHGGSLRVYAKLNKGQTKSNEQVDNLIKKEISGGLFELQTYGLFMKEILSQRASLIEKLHALKEEGSAIIAVGAAAKGNTFLNFCNLNKFNIDYVTDFSMHKQNKYTPLSRIPIRSDEIFRNYQKVSALILSWNLSDEIKDSLNKINPNINFLTAN